MNRRREELTGNIDVVDDKGCRQTFYEYTTFVEFLPIAGPATWAAGTKRLESAEGGAVNVNVDGTFTELATGRRFRRAA